VLEIKDNILIITIPADLDKSVFTEIIDFLNSRLNINRGKDILNLIEEYHQFDKDFKFNRDEVYNERLHIHR